MLREVVGQVGGTGALVDTEHLLRFLASYPKEAYVPRLAFFALHVLVADTVRCRVVYLSVYRDQVWLPPYLVPAISGSCHIRPVSYRDSR